VSVGTFACWIDGELLATVRIVNQAATGWPTFQTRQSSDGKPTKCKSYCGDRAGTRHAFPHRHDRSSRTVCAASAKADRL